LRGEKTIEVRGWSTRYRGELWLHAATHKNIQLLHRFNLAPHDLAFGALVGLCDLYDCIEFNDNTWASWRFRHLNEGPLQERRYAWVLRNPTRIIPKPFKGRLGLIRIQD
jgi:hypothetical protein